MSKPTVASNHAQISAHEKICAERWGETLSRIKRLEAVVVSGGGAIIVMLLSLLLK